VRGTKRAVSDEIQFVAWYERFNRLADDLYPGRYSREYVRDLIERGREITALARQKRSLIVAHNYVYPELQEVAKAVGDSLGLSLVVESRRAPRVDFCGVWFMGETAKINLAVPWWLRSITVALRDGSLVTLTV
jgi:hypothetical protein